MKFNGKFIEKLNINNLSEKAYEVYIGGEMTFYIDENGRIYEFEHDRVDKNHFVTSYKDIDELNKCLEAELATLDEN